ncbi:hypothetical protein [Levilinea saccharolytica]|uniref:Uncharacterized protein n=1 Tax=Levilinea saccharolytica TaxID=229921 RepID=A0A0P6YJ24_9CHLR|nr:hypothetical protein [Levilinea saccharolytica]KPL85103.1 hypothetical protein ADN01_06965 [Levilinea saccharolytica]GAP18218.1 hypothetical protein LSAC_02105 [Levilinea saccharolytica]
MTRLRWARLWIGGVLFFNVQCALAFLIQPQAYVGAFELQGTAGEVMVRSMGILFLMWNVPYAFALLHPVKNRLSLRQAWLMQAIGLMGEVVLLATLPEGHAPLRATTARFIWFDGAGLLALTGALMITRSGKEAAQEKK